MPLFLFNFLGGINRSTLGLYFKMDNEKLIGRGEY